MHFSAVLELEAEFVQARVQHAQVRHRVLRLALKTRKKRGKKSSVGVTEKNRKTKKTATEIFFLFFFFSFFLLACGSGVFRDAQNCPVDHVGCWNFVVVKKAVMPKKKVIAARNLKRLDQVYHSKM